MAVTLPELETQPVSSSSTELSVHAGPSHPPAARAPIADRSSGRSRDEDRGYAARFLGATFATVGGAGLATGGVLAVLAVRRRDHALDYCGDNGRQCTPHGIELRQEAGKLTRAATISAVAGGALLVTGFVVYTAAPHGQDSQAVSVTAVPEASTRGVTFQVRGAF